MTTAPKPVLVTSHSCAAFCLAGLLFSAGCGQQGRDSGAVRPSGTGVQPVQGPRAAPSAAPASQAHIKLVDANGRLIAKLDRGTNGYKLYDEKDQLLARLKVESDRVKAEDAAGKPVLKLKHKDNKCKAEDESGTVLFSVKPHDGGDYKLEDAAGKLLYRIKKEDYGYKIVGPANQTLYKLKTRSDRVVADAPDGRKKMEIKGSPNALAASALLLESFDLPRRAALFAYLSHFEAKTP